MANTEVGADSKRGRGRPKGGEKRGGRQKGTPNKVTADLKAAIMGAFHAKGGQRYLERVAEDDPKTFCILLGKILPAEIKADVQSDGELRVRWMS